ncbi:MAG TPA: hypothetical protein VGP64_18050, partial [Polyangia bacterium]
MLYRVNYDDGRTSEEMGLAAACQLARAELARKPRVCDWLLRTIARPGPDGRIGPTAASTPEEVKIID